MVGDRRAFLKLAGIPFLPGFGRWWTARELIRAGSLGRVVFCRVPPGRALCLPFLLGTAIPLWERNDRDELVLCGTEATLVLDAAGSRRYP